MATTIKISDESKERLDRIRARLLLQGRKLKQEEVIDLIISLAEASPVLHGRGEFRGVTSGEKERFFSFTFDADGSTKSIDEEIYS